jgi:uncharacterized membrane protein
MLNNKRGYIIALIVIIVLQLIEVFFFAFQKQGYFIDEILSYSLANSYFREKYSPDALLYDKWTEPEYFSKLVVVSEEHRFAYNSVFFNQSNDVHPPLYYVILHTICSFFPDNFSKWYGLSINIFLFVLCNIFLFLASNKIFRNHYLALLPSIIWGFSAGAISTVIFIRMYMLLTTLIVIFAYCHFVLIEKEKSNIRLFLIFIFTLLGFMTHYYFLIFAFFWYVLYLLFYLIQRKGKQIFRYSIILLSALLAGILIFPRSIYHIFSSNRGEPAIKSISNISDLPNNIKTMLVVLSRQQFDGFLKELIIIFTCLFLLKLILIFISKLANHHQAATNLSMIRTKKIALHSITDFYVKNILLLSLTISMIATFIVVTKVSPYLTTRYLYFIYPIISLLAVFYIYRVCSLFIKNRQILFTGILLLFTVLTTLTYKRGQVEYIYPGYKVILSTARDYSNYDCIYITNRSWTIYSNIFELSEFQKTYVIKIENVPDLPHILKSTAHEKGIIIYIDNTLNQEEVLKKVLSISNFDNFKLLYSTDYNLTYLIN